MRPVTKGDDELQTHDQDARIAQDHEDVLAHIMTKWVHFLVSQRSSDEVESQVEVGQTKVCKQEIEELIDKFDMQQDLSGHRVISVPDLLCIEDGVHGSEESSVQPTTSLRDELGN